MSSYASATTDLPLFGLPSLATQGISTATLQAELDAASGFADGYLNARYNLPLTAWGQDLREAVCKIAGYNILVVRGFNPDDGPDNLVRLRYKDALDWLKGVAGEKLEPVGIIDSSSTSEPGIPFVLQPRFDYGRGTQSGSGAFPATPSVGPTGFTIGSPKLRGW